MKENFDQPREENSKINEILNQLSLNVSENKKEFESKEDIIQKNKEAHDKLKEKLPETREAFSEILFGEINPQGLPLEKLKEQLENDIQDLRLDLRNIRLEDELDEDQKIKMYDDMSEDIRKKQDQAILVENFLMTSQSDPFEEDEYENDMPKDIAQDIHKKQIGLN